MSSFRVNIRLVFAHPEDFWCGESGQGAVARELNQAGEADALGDLVTLRLRALIVPEDRGAQDVPTPIEQDEAVHLPSEANSGNVWLMLLIEHSTDRLDNAVPPVRRILLAPE